MFRLEKADVSKDKNIDVVMDNQKDLVAIQTELKPVAALKG